MAGSNFVNYFWDSTLKMVSKPHLGIIGLTTASQFIAYLMGELSTLNR
jgi:hypothetical protein